jgi:cell division protein FtsQ
VIRDQARADRRGKRKRTVRSASAVEVRRRGGDWLRAFVRALPRLTYLLLLILSSWLLYYSLNSPYFAASEIVVSGTRQIPAERVQSVTEVMGSNLLLLQPEGIARSVRSIVAVRDVGVTLAMPGRVEITVAERMPLAQWQTEDGTFLVDREGVVFGDETPSSPLPVVVDLDGPALELGSRIDSGVLAAVETLRKGLSTRLGAEQRHFDYSRSTGIVVPFEEGLRVVFGDASDLDAKLASLLSIQDHLKSADARAEIIDLRFKGRPVYTVVPSPEAVAKSQR